jgi:molybdopterin molybdotransferase
MITVEKALQMILDSASLLEETEVPLLEATRRVLAEDILAPENIPATSISTSDGYALKAEAARGASSTSPVTLELVGELRNGEMWDEPLKRKQALRLPTGAPLPEGADAVVSVDDTVRESTNRLKVYKEVQPGANVKTRGEEISQDSLVLPRGRVLGSADIGTLALLGVDRIKTHRPPRVSFITTGDGILPLESKSEPGKLRLPNPFILYSQVKEYGAFPVDLGIVSGKKEEMKPKFEEGLSHDIFVNLPGPSPAYFESAREALNEMGIDLKFWKVGIRPGRSVFFGTFDHTLVYGLPPNLVSAIVILEEFIRPAILKMMGYQELRHLVVTARLESDLKGGGGLTHFILAEVKIVEGAFLASPVNLSETSTGGSLGHVNALVVLPPEIPYVRAGDQVKVQIIGPLKAA